MLSKKDYRKIRIANNIDTSQFCTEEKDKKDEVKTKGEKEPDLDASIEKLANAMAGVLKKGKLK